MTPEQVEAHINAPKTSKAIIYSPGARICTCGAAPTDPTKAATVSVLAPNMVQHDCPRCKKRWLVIDMGVGKDGQFSMQV